MEDFFLRALLGGIGVAIVAGPFGSFVVWRRLAYFGDTLAHAAMLGIACGFLLHINLTLGVVAVGLLVALALHLMQRRRRLPGDTALGILSHASLSLGMVLLAFMERVRFDLVGYLFGDILAISRSDILWIFSGGSLCLLLLLLLWRPLLAITLHEDLARVEGVPVERIQLIFLALMALIVALMLKIVGLVLVTSLFIIPAATARKFTRTPETMALAASLSGCLAVGGGLWASLTWDTPAGPSIVLCATLLFLLSSLLPNR
jgi:zinc transport system permease protein